MDFKDLIRQLGERTAKMKENTLTEEATKTAFIMPFIQTLGYEIFNPMEVVPEFDADIPGLRKGEKVDYAILKDGEPKILIECKHWKQNLELHDGQLLRYFHVTKARFAILTNGVVYKFFTDLFEPNKMDEKPFFEFDITKMSEPHIEELKKFHKSYFDEATITTAANELIYTNEIKQLLTKELKSPSDEFVKYLAQKTYPGRLTQNVLLWFSDLVKRSAQQVLNEMINDRLTSALKQETKEPEKELTDVVSAIDTVETDKPVVETTQEEMEGFYIVKSICRTKVDIARILHKDVQNYFAVFLDHTKKPICRLHLNRSKKYLETFEAKDGNKHEIQTIDDIYKFSDLINKTLERYETD